MLFGRGGGFKAITTANAAFLIALLTNLFYHLLTQSFSSYTSPMTCLSSVSLSCCLSMSVCLSVSLCLVDGSFQPGIIGFNVVWIGSAGPTQRKKKGWREGGKKGRTGERKGERRKGREGREEKRRGGRSQSVDNNWSLVLIKSRLRR